MPDCRSRSLEPSSNVDSSVDILVEIHERVRCELNKRCTRNYEHTFKQVDT